MDSVAAQRRSWPGARSAEGREVPARPAQVGGDARRIPGRRYRPAQTVRHRVRRFGQAKPCTQRAGPRHREWRAAADRVRQHAGRRIRQERVRHVLHRLRALAQAHRADENMFVGVPSGNCDRLLDVSTAVTGSLFFVPVGSVPRRRGRLTALVRIGGRSMNAAPTTRMPGRAIRLDAVSAFR